ncbi:MAG: peptidoglycan-binding protein [Hyphomicrobium sp.]|nr:peptidoglycan-binding protein [Hyphomicrobium sp.]
MIEHIGQRAGLFRSKRALASLSTGGLAIALATAGTAAALPLAPVRPPAPATINSVVPVAVFGADDRVPLPRRLSDLESSIGLLYEPKTRSVCTAFCVAPNVVATASHCLFGTRGHRAPSLASMTFRPASLAKKRGGVKLAGADRGTTQLNVLTGSTNLSVAPPIEATRDWAFARLSQPICKGAELKLGARSAAALSLAGADRPVFQIGFHLDVGDWRPMLSPPCIVRRPTDRIDGRTIAEDFADAQHLLLHTCDTGGASSGSPLLADGPQGLEVVGINVGTYLQSRVLTQAGEVVHRYRSDTVANTAVSVTAFREPLLAFRSAELIEVRADLRLLQESLAALGHYRGDLDGRYGPQLRHAIEAFERSERRLPTGIASRSTLARIQALAAERASASAAAKTPPTLSTLETGSVAPRP